MLFVNGLPNSLTLTMKIFSSYKSISFDLNYFKTKVSFERKYNFNFVILVHYLWQTIKLIFVLINMIEFKLQIIFTFVNNKSKFQN